MLGLELEHSMLELEYSMLELELEYSTLERLQEQARGEGITVERHFIQQATLTVTRSDIVKWKV